MKNKPYWLMPFFAFSLFAVPGCGGDDSDATAGNCSVVDLGDGTSAIRCPDGTELVVQNGQPGEKGDKGDDGDEAACTLGEEGGKYTLTCGDQTVVIGDACEDGFAMDLEADPTSGVYMLFRMSNCTWVRGNVIIDGVSEIPELFSRIEKVGGALVVVDTDVEEVSFPNLTEVGELYVDGNGSLTTLDFPALTKAGYFAIEENDALTNLSFPELTEVVRDFYVMENHALTSVDGFPKLETVGSWFSIGDNAALETIGNFTSLKRVGGLEIWDNTVLTSVADFSALEKIAGSDGVAGFSLLYVGFNPVLASFGGLGSVSTIDGNVTIMENPELSQDDVDALLEGIDVTGDKNVCGNKGGDACGL